MRRREVEKECKKWEQEDGWWIDFVILKDLFFIGYTTPFEDSYINLYAQLNYIYQRKKKVDMEYAYVL